MSAQQRVGAAADLPPGTVVGVGRYAVGNAGGHYFAVTRRCRHLGADLAGGSTRVSMRYPKSRPGSLAKIPCGPRAIRPVVTS